MFERGLAIGVWAAALAVVGASLWLLSGVLVGGAERLSIAYFFTAPLDAGRAGGVGPILVSTLAILAVCLLATVPLAIGTAVWMTELAPCGSLRLRTARASLDVLAGVPSIVFGLFGNAFFCVALGLGFSILAGGLTLACMSLPLLARSTELGLREVAPELRQGAAALGLSKSAAIGRLYLPAAAPAIAAGLVLGIGRALAETAALIFTSGYVDRMPESLFDSGRSLSVHVYDLSMNVPGGDASAWAAAFVLLGVLALSNASATQLTRRLGGQR